MHETDPTERCPICDDNTDAEHHAEHRADHRARNGGPAGAMPVTRRRFLGRALSAGAATMAASGLALPFDAWADGVAAAPETLAQELFTKIRARDTRLLGMMSHRPDAPLLHQVHANWDISRVRIGDLPVVERSLVDKILRRSLSRDAYTRVRRQMREDAAGMVNYSCGFFGQPDHDGFQFAIAGRHFTLRVDGAHDDKVAFGGPILYGHAEERRAELNIWHDHARRANTLLASLDEPLRVEAYCDERPPGEFDVSPRERHQVDGVPLSKMPEEQRALTIAMARDLLGMYGEKALAEVDATVAANGGWGKLKLAFYRRADKHDDRLWDVWRLEGPGFLYFFRGTPHVHAYINIFKV